VQSFRAGDCVAFIGAGFTKPIGMPLWRPLLSTLIAKLRADAKSQGSPQRLETLDYAENCITEGQLPRAASAIRIADPGGRVNQYLAELFDSKRHFHNKPAKDAGKGEMQARLSALVSLPWAGVITTNYDTLVSDHFLQHGPGARNVCYDPTDNLGQALKSSDRPFVVHLHGNIRSGGLVLTEGDYDRGYLASSPLQGFLSALFLRYTLVFIGTQVEDRFVEIRRQLQHLFPHKDKTLSPEYVLLPTTDRQRGEYLTSTGGFTVHYYANATKDHEGLVPLMRSIEDDIAAVDQGMSSLDDVCKRLIEIIQKNSTGVTYSEIVSNFWSTAAPFVTRYRDLNDRELGYRLYYLLYRQQVLFDPVNNTWRPTNTATAT
jgi:SIR2-like domain